MKLLALGLVCFLLVGLSYSISVENHGHAAVGLNHGERNPACRGRGPPPPPPPQGGGNGGGDQTGEQGGGSDTAVNGDA